MDEVVKVKREDLKGLVEACSEVYTILDNFGGGSISGHTILRDMADDIRKAINILEECPSEVEDVIIEDDKGDEK